MIEESLIFILPLHLPRRSRGFCFMRLQMLIRRYDASAGKVGKLLKLQKRGGTNRPTSSLVTRLEAIAERFPKLDVVGSNPISRSNIVGARFQRLPAAMG